MHMRNNILSCQHYAITYSFKAEFTGRARRCTHVLVLFEVKVHVPQTPAAQLLRTVQVRVRVTVRVAVGDVIVVGATETLAFVNAHFLATEINRTVIP